MQSKTREKNIAQKQKVMPTKEERKKKRCKLQQKKKWNKIANKYENCLRQHENQKKRSVDCVARERHRTSMKKCLLLG